MGVQRDDQQFVDRTKRATRVSIVGPVEVPSVPAAYDTASSTAVAVTTSSNPLLPANPDRRWLALSNEGITVMFVKLGTGATAEDYSVRVAAGTTFIMDNPIYTGALSAIMGSGEATARMTELLA